MRVVVTGAAGFVGANLVRSLAADGHEVHGVAVASSDRWRLSGLSAPVHALPVASAGALLEVFHRVRPEVVINTAAHGAYPHQQSIERMCNTNIVLVDALTDWCVATRASLLHLGSSSEYGAVDHAPAEHEAVHPNSTYAVTKAAGTHLVCDAVRRRGLRGVVFRLYSVYGPWEEPTRLLPTVATHALAGRLPPRLVPPTVARDFVYVDDVIDAVRAWMRDPVAVGDPSIVNIGSGVQTTMAELIAVVQRIAGVSDEPQWGSMEQRRWDTDRWQADPTTAAERWGWTARTHLEQGITALMEFVAAHPDRYRVAG